ncbi:MAG: hypothetical protein WC529_01695 [Candidatus Margulisiibacteriota bacterium]
MTAPNNIGQGGQASFALPVTRGNGYNTSIQRLDDLFEASPSTVIILGSANGKTYLARVEAGQIVVYERGADGTTVKSDKNIRDVLTAIYGRDTNKEHLSKVLKQLITLAASGGLNGDVVDLKALYDAVVAADTNQRDKKVADSVVTAQVTDAAVATATSAQLQAVTDVETYCGASLTGATAEDIAAQLAALTAAETALKGTYGETLPAAIRDRIDQAKAKLNGRNNEITEAATADARAQAAAAAKEQARTALSVPGQTLAQLTAVYTANSAAIQADPELQTLLGEQARLALLAAPTTEIPNSLRPALNAALTAVNQRIVSFWEEGARRTLVVEGTNESGWTVAAASDGAAYIIGEGVKLEENRIAVERDVAWRINPEFTARVYDLTAPAVSGYLPAEFYVKIGVADVNNDGTVDIGDIDTDNNGIDRSEAAKYGINERLFTVVDNMMSPTGTAGNGLITVAELQRFYEIAEWHAMRTGMALDQVLMLYKTQPIISVSRADVDGAATTIAGRIEAARNGAPLGAANLEGILTGAGYAAHIAKSVAAQFEGQANIDVNQVVQAMILRLYASRSSAAVQREYYGITVPLERLFPAGADYTAANINAYLSGQTVQVGRTGSGAYTTRQINKALEELSLSDNPDQYYREHPELENNTRALGFLAEYYRDSEYDPQLGMHYIGLMQPGDAKWKAYAQLAQTAMTQGDYAQANEILQQLPAENDYKNQLLVQLAQKAVASNTQADRELALAAIRQVATETDTYQVSAEGQQQTSIQEYVQVIQARASLPQDLIEIRNRAIPGGTLTDVTAAQAQITALEGLRAAAASDPARLGYINMMMGEIYAKLAEKEPDLGKKLELLNKAQLANRAAYDSFSPLANQPNTPYEVLAKQVLNSMARTAETAVRAYDKSKKNTQFTVTYTNGRTAKLKLGKFILALAEMIPEGQSVQHSSQGLVGRSQFIGYINNSIEVANSATGSGGGGGGGGDSGGTAAEEDPLAR